MRTWIDRAIAVMAWGLLSSMLIAALHDASFAWDVWYYHLPFAARIAGIVPADQFTYDPMNQARFEGFPLLAEALQGSLWRITGRAESANLVAFASVPLFAWFVKRRFGVAMHWTIIALVAVPLVQIHMTCCYVDLPANAATAALVLLAISAWASDAPPPTGELASAGFAAALAVNMKALMHPIVLVALVAIAARALPPLVRDKRWRVIAIAALALPIIFATPLKNLVEHHNPYYPVAFRFAAHTFPGPDEPYASAPVWLASSPRPIRFACSLLELGLRPLGDARRWTVDQWTPPDATGYRMGGFFGAYVVLHVAFFAYSIVRGRKARDVRAAGVGFALLTALVSMLPQSHELRYYMVWIIVLVALNLWLARRVELPRFVLSFACAASLVAVVALTHGEYVYPSGRSFDDLVHAEVDDAVIGKVHDGQRVCVSHAPWNFLWSARFHAPRNYAVREADVPADCEGAPSL